MSVILKAENISKQYRLGMVGTGTLSDDLKRWWYTMRGREDPFLKVGAVNDRGAKANQDYVWALKDINFEVKQGEVLGIIGKNGAGKSTLLKLLSRVTSPTTGSIKTRGRIASLLEIGTGFHPELTGRENIFMNGAVLGMTKSEIKRKLDEIIAFSGCEMYIDTPVKRYSSGMTVRLGFAVAAHLEPEILVVDEVLAVGDAEFQKKAIGKMQDLSTGEGRTVIFVSHNMASIKNLCTIGIVLANGKLNYEGTSEEAVNFYLRNITSSSFSSCLLERQDRSGNGKIKVKKVEMLDKDHKLVSEIISGEPLNLRITIHTNVNIDFSHLKVAVNFQTNSEEYILSFISDEMGVNFDRMNHQDFFILKIPRFYLRSNQYKIRVLLAEGDTNAENFLDIIEGAAEINVLPGDVWGTGKINRKGNAAVFPASIDFHE